MAIRDLEEIQKRADKLTAAQQLQLAKYLLGRVGSVNAGEESILSETALAKDWLRPEEDRAWANL